MPYKNAERQQLATRGAVRTNRHGNWRQTYIDCMGICVARVNGDILPCGKTEFLELHELFGENGHRDDPKFQVRVLLCNFHHSLIEDGGHQIEFIMERRQPSRLTEDVVLEQLLEGGYREWVEKWKLDDSRAGSALFTGPHIEDYGDG